MNKTLYIIATRSYLRLVERAHERGFNVNLLFFWLESPDAAIRRVAQRVKEGGHNIPKDTIIRRYHLGINNFFKLFRDRVDCWMLVDNDRTPREIIADSSYIHNHDLYNKVLAYVTE